MNITVTGRHMEMTDGLKNHIESSLGKISSHFDKVIDADVVLDVQKQRHIAEVNLNANGVRIHSKEDSADMYTSVDAAIAKLDRQVLKYKKRINRHKPRNAKEARLYNHIVFKPGHENGTSNGVEEEVPKHREVTHESLTMKPMLLDEAVMQLELANDLFLVFVNVETSQLNVLYKHKRGTLGVIEPQF